MQLRFPVLGLIVLYFLSLSTELVSSSSLNHTEDNIILETVSEQFNDQRSCAYRFSQSAYWDPTGLSEYPLEETVGSRRFTLNFCSESEDPDCTSPDTSGKPVRGTGCLYEGGRVYSLGNFVTGPAPEYSLINPEAPEEGMVLRFVNGSICKEGNKYSYTFRIHLICDMTADVPTAKLETMFACGYVAKVRTKLGCVGYTESGGISVGWILIITILVAALLYFIIGFIICMKRYGKTGKDAIPNIQFWTAFFANVVAGVRYTFSKLTGLCKKKNAFSTDPNSYDSL